MRVSFKYDKECCELVITKSPKVFNNYIYLEILSSINKSLDIVVKKYLCVKVSKLLMIILLNLISF